MSAKRPSGIHWSFWVIGAIALIWNVLGAINFIAQMNPDWLAAYRDSERAMVEGRPFWATVGFALAAFAGVLGCLMLLLRKSAAVYLFVVSLAGVLVTVVHAFGTGVDFGVVELVGITLMPLAVASFLIWYARQAQNWNWIR